MNRSRHTIGSLLIWLVLIGLCIAPPASSAAPAVAVIYPDVREPYRSVFRNIITGIEAGVDGSVMSYVLKKEYDPSKLIEWLEKKRVRSVVALGRRGSRAAKELPDKFEVIVGAVQVAPNTGEFSGITLAPAPELLFDQLKTLAPGVTRITVVYNPEHTGWLIDLARRATSSRGLLLNAIPAKDLQEAAPIYRDFLAGHEESTEAIWLPQDPSTVDERAILPFILEKAWKKNLVVFSSNPAHVRRGALFSLYPDNVGMGRSLAALALGRSQNGTPKTAISPLQDLLIAVNLRTADHLRLKLSARQRREFDLVFPSR